MGKHLRRLLGLDVLAAAALLALAGLGTQALGADAGGLEALVQKLPAETNAAAEEVYKEILKGAPASIVELTKMLLEPGKGDDSKVRFTVHGLAIYVYRPDAEAERKMFAQALVGQLEGDLPSAVKGFLIRQLQLAGGPESVEAIGKFLLDKDLSEYAAQALLAMKDKAAIPLFQAALPKATGACRVTIIQDLGILRAAKGLPDVAKALGDEDREVRLAAAFALANSADPAAVEPILKAASVEVPYERSQATDAALLLPRRLGEEGEKKAGERICRDLLKTRTSDADIHVRCAALTSLAAAAGADAMDDVLAAMSSNDPDLQAAGVAAAIAMPGERATQRWVERLKTANAPGKISILDLLAKRGDPSALPAIVEAMKDADEAVRLAAIKATATAGNEQAVAPLVAKLTAESAPERGAAQSALLQVPGKAASDAIAKAIPAASADAKAALLGVLAGRRDKEHIGVILSYTTDADPKVSAAAISSFGKLAEAKDLPALTKLLVDAKDDAVRGAGEKALAGACSRLGDKDASVAALAPALGAAAGPARAALLRVLGGIGNQKAYEVVRAGLADKDDEVKDAAIRALSDWRDATPTAELLQIAKTAEKPTQQVLALRGYVRMIGLAKDRSAADCLKMCQEAMAAARRDDEKRLVLSALSEVPTVDALKMADGCLANATLKNEAASAAIRIAKGVSGGDRDLAKQAIAKAAAATDNAEVAKQAKEALAFIERNEDFVTAWMASGPYKGGKTSVVHPPEDPNAKDVKWKLISATGEQPGFVDLNKELGAPGECGGYLRCQVFSPKDQPAVIECGSDDGIKIWLNGAVVHDNDVPRSFQLNQDKVKITLKEGWNPLLVKVVNGGGGWEAAVRLRAADGGKLEGIKTKAE